MERKEVLRVNDLQTHFKTDDAIIPAVDHVDFHVKEGEVLGIVGESGCGKSVTSLSLMGLIPKPPGEIVGGEVLLHGEDIVHLKEKEMRKIRGKQIAMIFQEPMTSLNPLFTIGDQMTEAVFINEKISKRDAKEIVVGMLHLVVVL